MSSFDYLHSERIHAMRKICEFRVPERFASSMYALLCAFAVVGGMTAIDACRLRAADRLEQAYRHRYDLSAASATRANLYYRRVRGLIALDERIRRVARSGERNARSLAEIAGKLPKHAWLTAIADDADGMALEGSAQDLDVLSRLVHGLQDAHAVHDPTLVSAQTQVQAAQSGIVKYDLHVRRSEP